MTGGEAANGSDGRRDFDFLHGEWSVANRRVTNPLDGGKPKWVEFEATAETEPLLGGLANLDRFHAPDFPGRPGLEALTLRLYDPEHAVWRIWWASSIGGGRLDTPVEGSFVDGIGVFECDDVLNDLPVTVRYVWSEITESSARWEQSFSFDAGKTWAPNWIMRWARRTPA
jgi:hypothetical protein